MGSSTKALTCIKMVGGFSCQSYKVQEAMFTLAGNENILISMKSFPFLACASLLLLSSCGEHIVADNKPADTKAIQLTAQVAAVEVDLETEGLEESYPLVLTIIVEPGAPCYLEMKGGGSQLAAILASTEGSKLQIKTKDGYRLKPEKPLQLELHLSKLEAVDLSGAVTAVVASSLTTQELELELSGNTKINLGNLQAGRLSFSQSGASKVMISDGHIRHAEGHLSGAAQASMAGAMADSVWVDGSGAMAAEVHAGQYLNASLSGAAAVKYKGTPLVEQETSSGASLQQLP